MVRNGAGNVEFPSRLWAYQLALNAQETEGQDETNPEEQPETESTEAEEAPEAPASIAEAALQKLNQDLAPLIDDLKKPGAKGALKILQKRIPKLTEQRDTERTKRLLAEDRVTQLETELNEREQKPAAPNGPAANTHPAVAKISQALGEVDNFIKHLRAMPNGGEMDDGDGGKINLTAEEVSDHLEKLRDKRTELVAERKLAEQQVRAAYDETFQKIRTAAAKVYPWLTKPDAPEQARLKKSLESIPGLKDHADHELIVARYLRGMKAEQDDLAKAKAPGPRKAPPAKDPTAVNTAPPTAKAGPGDEVTKAKRAVEAAEKQFKQTGKREDLQRLESAKTALKRVQK